MREYLETFFRRKWLFFVPFAVVLAVAVAGGVYSSWQYTAKAALWVEPNPVLGQAAANLTASSADQADKAIAFLQDEQKNYQDQLATASAALAQFEAAHPPATRASMSDLDQLEYQRLKTDYETILDHLRYLGGELDKALFSKNKFLAEQASTYVIKDAPTVPQTPDLSVNKLATIILLGLAVAVGLG